MVSAYSYKKINEFDVEDDSKPIARTPLDSEPQNRLGWLRKPSVSDCSRKNAKIFRLNGWIGVLAAAQFSSLQLDYGSNSNAQDERFDIVDLSQRAVGPIRCGWFHAT